MGVFDDFMNSLDNKGTLDPVVIASSLHELHNQEISSAEGKIASIEIERDDAKKAVAERDSLITTLKAKNWDLANRVPADNNNDSANKPESTPNPGNESFKDFIVKE